MTRIAFFFAIAMASCILSPEKKVIIHDHEAPAACMDKEDSVTFTDSGEVWNYSCRYNPTK